MRDKLFLFQETALAELHEKIGKAHVMWSEKDTQVISFSAPTGAGKTIIMTALFEEIIFGHAYGVAEPDSVFVWLSDMPELNEQTRLKIESKSEKFRARNIKVIDSSFDAECFPAGGIYFLNTQKLGSDKLLTQEADTRQYTIWQTLTNTAMRQPKSFYVIIDEAHRGTFTSAQAEKKAQSIMQKFLIGSKEDNMPPMPLVIGVTATPQRFQNLIDVATKSTIQKVVVPPEEVRESGLLKDRIIIHYPDMAISADMTMFKESVADWSLKCARWLAYCESQEMPKPVKPILVVQVEDGNEREATQIDLAACIEILENALGRNLLAGEVVHTFNDRDTLKIHGIDIYRVDASRIEEDEKVMVVFFKMNLSTGWDCPRAEAMMSFRHATDYTYIAQLLGRMVRTPLARRIDADAELNNVSLFLPYFDTETVKLVEQALRDSEAVLPSETGSHKELITLKRNPEFADIFSRMELVTYRIDSARKQPAIRRLIALARALTQDMIVPTARKTALNKLLDEFDSEISKLRVSGKFDELAKALTGFTLSSFTINYGSDEGYQVESAADMIRLSAMDLASYFEQAGKKFGEGLHKEYWIRHSRRDEDEIKKEIIVLISDIDAMTRLESFAEKLFCELYDANKGRFKNLKEERKELYKKLAMSSAVPMLLDWELPSTIDFSIADDAIPYENHLFIPQEGDFKVNLDTWESGVIKEELKRGAIAWLRNLDRKKWAMEIPYETGGVTTSMFPDLIVVRADENGYVYDLLEPHDPSRKDNFPKAVGFAKFAEQQGDYFGRIQLIRKARGADGREHFFRLDMGRLDIQQRVRSISSNDELDIVFKDYQVTEE